MKRLAIIPARGGSKRIPNKNIKDFCGLPMIAHAITAAKQAAIFNTIHVSTDSQTIADTAKEYGHSPDFMRPDNLSDDHASMMESLKYVVEKYQEQGEHFDTIALIYATSPLIDPSDLTKACEEFEKSDGQKALLAVTAFPAPIEHAFRLDEKNKSLSPDNANALSMRTQDLKHAYYDAGMFAMYTPKYILNSTGGGDFNSFTGYEVPSYRVTDIDWPDDWNRAENLYKALHSKH